VTTAFAVMFGIFVLLMLGLVVAVLRWGVGRDRAERAARHERSGSTAPDPPGAGPGGPTSRHGTRRSP
jgi:hypothetical protein